MSKTRPLGQADKERANTRDRDPIFIEPAHRRMAIGAKRGIKVVTVFYMLTLVGFIVTAGHLFDERSFGVIDIGLMYLAWGVCGGALGGLAIPIARGWASSIPVMALIFLPLAVAVRVLDIGWADWNTGDVILVAASSLLMGLLWGPLAWRQLHKNE